MAEPMDNSAAKADARSIIIATNTPVDEGLTFSDFSAPGITRKRLTNGWGYYFAGKRIADKETVRRLDAIGLPPAYERCWFCPDEAGHIQAIGYDARGRRQYRYHPDFRIERDRDKFDRCAPFGRALAALRRQMDRDLNRRVYDKTTIIAAIVRLLDITRIRIGGAHYARENGSFGATTLRKRHARVSGQKVQLSFKAKSGKAAFYVVDDRTLARVVRRCQELPGQSLFAYRDADGTLRSVTSQDVNAYLKSAMGSDFTAKDFRTWGASLIAYDALCDAVQDESGPLLKHILATVADALGNTPAMARKAYIHPLLIDMAKNGSFVPAKGARAPRGLLPSERALVALLEARAGAIAELSDGCSHPS